jgi:hypothetical protein
MAHAKYPTDTAGRSAGGAASRQRPAPVRGIARAEKHLFSAGSFMAFRSHVHTI